MTCDLKHRITDDGFTSAACRRLLDYWRSRTDETPVPRWRDIQLVDLQRDIQRIVVKDAAEGEDFSIRFCGEHIAPHFKNAKCGSRLSELFDDEERARMHQAFSDAFSALAPVKLEAHDFNGFKGAMEAVVLPVMSDDADQPAHIIALFDFED